MDSTAAKLFAAQLRTDLPTLDLHGLSPADALVRVDQFLYQTHGRDAALKIIYGIGTGRLEQAVVGYLLNHPLVATLQAQTGYCFVLFT